MTIAANLATLPLVLSQFHLVAPLSLFANLLAVPLVALLALPVGLLGLLFCWSPLLSGLCFTFSGYVLQTTLFVVAKLLDVPGFAAHYLFLSRWQYLAIALLVLPLICLGAERRIRRKFPQILILCCAVAFSCGAANHSEQAEVTAYMLSVGQGESILLVDSDKYALLIDGGGLYSDRFDVGKRLLAPAFGELGVRRLDAVLLSHDHPDHRKGLKFILQHFPVAQFWTSLDREDLHPDLQDVLHDKEIGVRTFSAGWTAVDMAGFGELQLFSAPDKKNKNDSSLVLYLATADGGLLLTGDLEKRGVNRLLRSGLPGPVSLLKLPHHGSRHSATEKLIDALRPDVCVVSAGYQNRYRFPANQLLDYLHLVQIPLYRTDTMGTIRARAVSGRWRLDRWRDPLFR
mgnify:CR=1 FL=1